MDSSTLPLRWFVRACCGRCLLRYGSFGLMSDDFRAGLEFVYPVDDDDIARGKTMIDGYQVSFSRAGCDCSHFHRALQAVFVLSGCRGVWIADGFVLRSI